MANTEYDILGNKNNPIKLKAHIKKVSNLKGIINIPIGSEEPILEDLTITPSFETQTFTPTEENTYYENVTCEAINITTSPVTLTPTENTQEVYPSENEYFNKVTVNPIPSEYIIPTGSLDIDENGTYDITNYATINVSVSSSPKLPSQFQKVEYLESTGTQYINTGYYADGGSSFEFKITYGTTRGVVFGSYNSYWTNGYGYYHNNGNGDTEWVHYYGNTSTGYPGLNNSTQEIKIIKGSVYINGQLVLALTPLSFSKLKYPTFFYAGNWGGTRAEQPISAKIYYFTIKSGDYPLMDFVPCYRKSDNVMGFYDIINQVFYTNAGTGDFIKGPDEN